MKRFRLVLVTTMLAGGTLAWSQEKTAGLKIVVIEGWEGVNVIQQNTAVKPIVEVRDKNDLPVMGAVVTFVVVKLASSSGSAAFAGNAAQITVATDAAGRATVSEFHALSRGSFDIQVRASYQGQTVTTTVRQTNFATAQEAANAGKTPGSSQQGVEAQSSASSSGGSGSAGAAGGGGGLSAGMVTGIAAAAAGGIGTAYAVKKLTENHAPTVTGITVTPTTGLQSSTSFSFSVQASDTDNDSLTYNWDFGNGTTSTSQAPSQTYASTGTFTVKVIVGDGKADASTQTSLTVRSVTATWRSNTLAYTLGTIQFTLTLTQSGSNVTGSMSGVTISCSRPPCQTVTGPTTGSVRSAAPRVSLNGTSAQWGGGTLRFTLDPSGDINTLTGTLADNTGSGNITFTRQ